MSGGYDYQDTHQWIPKEIEKPIIYIDERGFVWEIISDHYGVRNRRIVAYHRPARATKWQEQWEKAAAYAEELYVPLWGKDTNVDDTTPTVTAPVDANQDSTVSRQTSTTGGQKDQKLAQFSLIPPKVLYRLAEHYGKGAMKYAPDNWRRGYNWSLSYDALHRHLNAWWSGVDKDEEGNDHIIAALWHVVALAHWSDDEKLKEMFDNRPKSM